MEGLPGKKKPSLKPQDFCKDVSMVVEGRCFVYQNILESNVRLTATAQLKLSHETGQRSQAQRQTKQQEKWLKKKRT